MNWEAVGAISEAIGVVAILISLACVAVQIRFGLLLRNIFSSMQGAYIRHLSLENDARGFEGSARLLDEILQNPGVREWLMGKGPDWRSEFHELVDERLSVFQQNG